MENKMLQVKRLFLNIIENVSEYDDFDKKLHNFDNNNKGNLFELFGKLYFTLLPSYRVLYQQVHLYYEIPNEIKKKLKLPQKDKGIDGIILTATNEYLVLQVKFRKNKKTIPFGELATFPALAFGSKCRNINGGILFTNCYDVCEELSDWRYNNITYSCFDKCDCNFWQSVREYLKYNTITKHTIMTPLSHHNIIISIVENHYKNHNYGRLYLPCGTGKTFLAYWISIHTLHCHKILILVPSLYLLSETYETWAKQLYDTSYNFLLIGSDIDKKDDIHSEYKITTNMENISNQLKKFNDNVVVITTYHSSKVLGEVCNEINFIFDIIIFDEAHRTTGINDRMFTYLLPCKNLSHKRLYMTATEKIYHYNMSQLTKSQQEGIYSMDNEYIFGKLIYNYSTRQAIEDGQLVDYKIIAPFISSNNVNELLENNNRIIINNSECEIQMLALSILIIKAMNDFNIRHLLIFSNRNERAKKIMRMIKTLLDEKEHKIFCKYLDGYDSMNIRKYKIKVFEQSERGILSSTRILGEGVNIPICDSICFADCRNSTVDIIQCIGRCLRKCKLIPNKISHVIIPFTLNGNIEHFSDSNNASFHKLRKILLAMGTTDDLITEKFIIKNYNYCTRRNIDAKESINADSIGQTIDLKHFEQSIISKIFDRYGYSENRVRNKIVHENNRRYINGLKLIDTKAKCLKYLRDECESDIPNPDNWVKFCLGTNLFPIIRRLYYYSKEELITACHRVGIIDFETYKKYYKMDVRLPSPSYINDGFYQDLDPKFNIITLLDNANDDDF